LVAEVADAARAQFFRRLQAAAGLAGGSWTISKNLWRGARRIAIVGRLAGFFHVEERLTGLSKKGDDLEGLTAVVDFEMLRSRLRRASARADARRVGGHRSITV
jgi:hypothetical protein